MPKDQLLQIVNDRRYISIRLTAGIQGSIHEQRAEIRTRKRAVDSREINRTRNEQEIFDGLTPRRGFLIRQYLRGSLTWQMHSEIVFAQKRDHLKVCRMIY